MRLFLTTLLLTTIIKCDFKSSEHYRKEANKQEQLGNYEKAILLLDKAIEKDDQNIKALLDRGVDKSIIKDYTGSINDYSKVIEIDSTNSLAFLNRGKNKKRIGNYIDAIDDFNEAIWTKGGEDVYMDKVENPIFETGFEFDVKMEEIRFERGIAYYNIDSLRKAFADFNFCIQKGYLLSDCYYWRGSIYISYKNIEMGCKDLKMSQELNDPNAQSLIEKYCNGK